MALLAQLLGSEQGVARHRTNIGWRNESKDTLSKIKSRKDLERIIKELNAVRAVAFRGQENRLSTLLERLHYSSESVQWYLASGLLPVMVTRSFEFFYRLICDVRDEAYQILSGAEWSTSLAAAMLSTHSQKLIQIRTYLTEWRDCLVQVYVYLREAQRKDFHDESMIRELWRRPAASPPSDRYSHCHHSPAKARLDLADLEDDTALAVAEHVAATLVRTPFANHDTVVVTAPAACA
jgi:hypothetical protein